MISLESDDRPGTILKMLLSQTEGLPDLQGTIFNHYVSHEKFPELYAKAWFNQPAADQDLPLHDLISVLSNRIRDVNHTQSDETWIKDQHKVIDEKNLEKDTFLSFVLRRRDLLLKKSMSKKINWQETLGY